MSFENFTFYLFSTILVGAGLSVIFSRNPVHAALSLVLAFFTSAAIWLILEAEFLAISLILVYVGAVMVLFLFVVMMLDINLNRMKEGYWNYLLPALVVSGIFLAEIIVLVGGRAVFDKPAEVAAAITTEGNTLQLGRLLYTEYLYAFELAAVILLVAIVAAIALTLRRRKDTKLVNTSQQISATRANRLKIISMPVENKRSEDNS
ncbi:MAG TPA: NADH-quinone oxidoreductase subunit J [Betaproteobacteria bacterium]|jgi:NADH-quinone oxidoreductase subunit J|nr:NADH-quinone oxidoreductase subunit J [Betaproteobacteria bacterium]